MLSLLISVLRVPTKPGFAGHARSYPPVSRDDYVYNNINLETNLLPRSIGQTPYLKTVLQAGIEKGGSGSRQVLL